MFTVWSPFDGEPIPAPNETERDILLSQGYLAEPPAGSDDAAVVAKFQSGRQRWADGIKAEEPPSGQQGDAPSDEP